MLKCRDIAHHTSDYLDPNCPWHKKLAWHGHLILCRHCRRFVRHFKLSIRVASQMGRRTASETEVTEVLERIKRAPPEND